MGSISPVSSLIGETDPTGLGSQLGRSDFLRLLMAQVNNQNPLEPMQNSEFVSQLTQFSSLEQLMLIREASERLAPPLPGGEIFFSPPPPSREGEIQDRVVLNRPGGTEGAPSPEVTLEPGGTGGLQQLIEHRCQSARIAGSKKSRNENSINSQTKE